MREISLLIIGGGSAGMAAAIEAKKNAPKREKTCYFERAKMKRDAARLAKKPRTPKDKPKSKDKKQGIE
jgi:succinate dehydrogenase/fumarate reductase flavoprotein subunit